MKNRNNIAYAVLLAAAVCGVLHLLVPRGGDAPVSSAAPVFSGGAGVGRVDPSVEQPSEEEPAEPLGTAEASILESEPPVSFQSDQSEPEPEPESAPEPAPEIPDLNAEAAESAPPPLPADLPTQTPAPVDPVVPAIPEAETPPQAEESVSAIPDIPDAGIEDQVSAPAAAVPDPDLECDYAELLMDSQRYEEALDVLRGVERAFPDYIRAYRLEAAVFMQLKKYNLAVERLKEALNWAPRDRGVHRDLGVANQLWEHAWESQKGWRNAGRR